MLLGTSLRETLAPDLRRLDKVFLAALFVEGVSCRHPKQGEWVRKMWKMSRAEQHAAVRIGVLEVQTALQVFPREKQKNNRKSGGRGRRRKRKTKSIACIWEYAPHSS